MANILLTGLDREAAAAFSLKLIELGHAVDQQQEPDLIFISDDDVRCLTWLRGCQASTPIVVVSRVGGDEKWLAALEAGATDYCATDVDAPSLGWMIHNALSCRLMTAAA